MSAWRSAASNDPGDGLELDSVEMTLAADKVALLLRRVGFGAILTAFFFLVTFFFFLTTLFFFLFTGFFFLTAFFLFLTAFFFGRLGAESMASVIRLDADISAISSLCVIWAM